MGDVTTTPCNRKAVMRTVPAESQSVQLSYLFSVYRWQIPASAIVFYYVRVT